MLEQAGLSGRRRQIAAVQQALAAGEFNAAMASADRLLTSPVEIRVLKRIFAEAQRLDLLAALIWERRDIALGHLSSVADYMEMCRHKPQPEASLSELKAWLLDSRTPPVRFARQEYLHAFKVDDARQRDLFRIKYKGWEDPAAGSLFQRAEALASRCELSENLLEILGQYQGGQLSDRWEDDARLTVSFGHIFRDSNIAGRLLRRTSGNDPFLQLFCESVNKGFPTLVDMGQCGVFFRNMDTSQGLLLSTFHHHFAKLALALFKTFVPNNYTLHLTEIGGHGADSQVSGRLAAFKAVKALTAGRPVLLSPDGPFFSDAAAVEIRIHGIPVRFSAGAAIIAYEAHCRTGWYQMTQRDGRLVPVYEPGPVRKAGESVAQFRDRWIAFYAEQYEAALAASPGDFASLLRRGTAKSVA
ncbi:MAG TPA: hypothetical protein VGG10_04690 [Rhizomicrobium sp.]|jgi:hypothetical protein